MKDYTNGSSDTWLGDRSIAYKAYSPNVGRDHMHATVLKKEHDCHHRLVETCHLVNM